MLLVPCSNVKDPVLPSGQFKIVAGLPGPKVQDLSAPHLMEDPNCLALRKSSKIILLLLLLEYLSAPHMMEDPNCLALRKSSKIILLLLLLGKYLLLIPSAVPGLNVPVSNIP